MALSKCVSDTVVTKKISRIFVTAKESGNLKVPFERLTSIQANATGTSVLKNKHCLAVAPTGSGKTFIAASSAILKDTECGVNTHKLLLIVPLTSIATTMLSEIREIVTILNNTIIILTSPLKIRV